LIPLEIVDTIDSTSDELKRRLGAGLVGQAALLARRQSGGRGRLGRVWTSPPGNLYLSVLLRPETLRWPGHWSLLSALALAEAVCVHGADPARVRVKWPNDVLLGGGKLAGILLEAGHHPAPWLMLGIGVNLLVAPEGLGRATACLGPEAAPPEVFAPTVLDRLSAWRERYEAGGFETLRTAWLERGHRLGEAVTATAGTRRIEGLFAGLTETGAMRLDTPTGLVVVSSGEVL